jgi:hypothetical protein
MRAIAKPDDDSGQFRPPDLLRAPLLPSGEAIIPGIPGIPGHRQKFPRQKAANKSHAAAQRAGMR